MGIGTFPVSLELLASVMQFPEGAVILSIEPSPMRDDVVQITVEHSDIPGNGERQDIMPQWREVHIKPPVEFASWGKRG